MPAEPTNLYLIGYRCTGKTRVGRRVAGGLKWRFADSDALVESEAGRTIQEIVAHEGWEGFRRCERAALVSLCEQRQTVVATGGGVVLNEQNVRDMRRSGYIVWLRAGPKTIVERMRADERTRSQRPALTDRSVFAEIASVLSERQPRYQAASDFAVDTDHCAPAQVAAVIVDWFAQKQSSLNATTVTPKP